MLDMDRVRYALASNPFEPMAYNRPHDTFIRSGDVYLFAQDGYEGGMDVYHSNATIGLL
ncbi:MULTISPECIES: hypothetical protein [Nocardia]|uniref:hypothetical protein n=1 Tax=Nocardia TaxID=1817 RepID=UPI000A79B4CF|nr:MULTISPECIES: hypothetical protein [Nocardia]